MSFAKVSTRRVISHFMFSRAIFEAACRKSIFVFNYHEISDFPSRFSRDFGLNVPPALFRKQLSWIRKYFQVINPHELVSNTFDLPAAFITFDDGYASTFREGVRILRQAKLPATVFMNMAPVKGEVFWSGLVVYLYNYNVGFRKYLTAKYPQINKNLFLHCHKDDVRDFVSGRARTEVYEQARSYYGDFVSEEDLLMTQADVYLGNHLFNHYNAANLSLDELQSQYTQNETALKAYSNNVNLFSYPFGQPETCYNRRTDEAILSLGASRIFKAFPLPNRDSKARRLHRVSMFDHITDEKSFRYNCIFPGLFNQYFRKPKLSYV